MNIHNSKNTLWKGRTEGKIDPILMQIGESISLDLHLYEEDLKGSYVHARMLNKIGILNDNELNAILIGLKQIKDEIKNQKFKIDISLEDIHTHIENRLREIIGDIAGKLHTARSRNDQIALDTHLFVKRISYVIIQKLINLNQIILNRADETIDIIFPAYTHLQVAQPVRFSHYLLAYFWMFLRDIERFIFCYNQADKLPLGCGAATGVNYENDRIFLKENLNFSSLYENSMDAVSSRDHILNFLYAISALSIHFSRLCEEIIIYSSIEFSFIELPDELTTGSSIMPQKKNPDLAELIRGKTGSFISNLTGLFINLKGLPLTYNRDLQEDRKYLIDSLQILMVIDGTIALIERFKIQEENLKLSLEKGFATATDLADGLVKEKKLPFREAHHIVGELVQNCLNNNYNLYTIPSEERKKISPYLEDEEFYKFYIQIEHSVEKKISRGGTAKSKVIEQLNEARKQLENLLSNLPEPVNLELD